MGVLWVTGGPLAINGPIKWLQSWAYRQLAQGAGGNWGPLTPSFVVGCPGEFLSFSSLSEDVLEGMAYFFCNSSPGGLCGHSPTE